MSEGISFIDTPWPNNYFGDIINIYHMSCPIAILSVQARVIKPSKSGILSNPYFFCNPLFSNLIFDPNEFFFREILILIECSKTGWLSVYRPGAAHPIANAIIAN
jgi:hypothetical protein